MQNLNCMLNKFIYAREITVPCLKKAAHAGHIDCLVIKTHINMGGTSKHKPWVGGSVKRDVFVFENKNIFNGATVEYTLRSLMQLI